MEQTLLNEIVARVAAKLARACRPEHEDALRRYRAGLRHL